MDFKKNLSFKHIDLVVLFVFFYFLFWYLFLFISTDFNEHTDFILRVNAGKVSYTPHFMFFYLVNLMSGFTSKISLIRIATVVIVSGSTVAKYYITKQFLYSFSTDINHRFKKNAIVFIAVMLLFFFSIPDIYNFYTLRYMYLSRVPSVLWHNSTLIFVTPFALALFKEHLKVSKLEKVNFFNKEIIKITVLTILSIFIKPSFIFVFFPVYFLSILRYFNLNNFKKSVFKAIPLIIGSVALILQYIAIYYLTIGSFYEGKSEVVIGYAFEFLNVYIPYWYIPVGLIISYIFPIAVLICYKEILKFRPFLYALAYSFFGFIIGTFIIEEGPRKFHGNFTWQNIICMYMLVLACILFLLPKLFTKERYTNKFIVISGLFFLHVISGFLYLFHMYFSGHFS